VVIVLLLLWLVLRPSTVENSAELEQLAEKVQSVKSDLERLDRVLREDAEAVRHAADERGRTLRQELVASLNDSRTELAQALIASRKESLEASSGLREE